MVTKSSSNILLWANDAHGTEVGCRGARTPVPFGNA